MNPIETYFSNFDGLQKEKLNQIRTIIKEVLPDAEECIKYGIPTFKLSKNIVHYAAFKNHIGFYPGPIALEAFKEELISYKTSKGAIQFPLNDKLPKEIIKKITLFNLKNIK